MLNIPMFSSLRYRQKMSNWADLFVPDAVLRALAEKDFVTATPIQRAVLPPAIKGR